MTEELARLCGGAGFLLILAGYAIPTQSFWLELIPLLYGIAIAILMAITARWIGRRDTTRRLTKGIKAKDHWFLELGFIALMFMPLYFYSTIMEEPTGSWVSMVIAGAVVTGGWELIAWSTGYIAQLEFDRRYPLSRVKQG